ncbi:MAG: ribonuclease HII [Candidatus Melainabacteria bacterium]|nr:ribonuclease HII [Candidatus Melainabacteria bacterium]
MKKNKLIEFDSLYTQSFTGFYFIGIDEVGRGALAGPVIACAFSWKKKLDFLLVGSNKSLLELNDSKQLSKEQREKLYPLLLKLGDFGLGYASVQEIEKLNVLNATFLAMKRAYDNLSISRDERDLKPYLLVDGNKFNPYINCRQSCITHGDAKSSLIASASIIAKVYRDLLMRKISKLKRCKKFGWDKNKGYGTLFHRKAIKKHGITPLHRKLFVRKVFARLEFSKAKIKSL